MSARVSPELPPRRRARAELTAEVGRVSLAVALALAGAWLAACGGGAQVEAPALAPGGRYAILPAAEDAGAEGGERRASSAPLRE